MTGASAPDDGFRHEAVFYRGASEYRSAVLPFLLEGLARAEPVLVAVPGPAAQVVRAGLDGQSADVTFADMTELGRNPARVIPTIWDFAQSHRGRPVRFVAELAWPGRSAPELHEAVAHEAMINLAFRGTAVAVLCPYDVGRLDPETVASAARTHPVIRTRDDVRPSDGYAAADVLREAATPLPDPPDDAERMGYTADLRSVRMFVADLARKAGLTEDRTADLVLAVGEVAANTVRHTGDAGVALVWHTQAEVICQVSDAGRIDDPLAGLRRPSGPSGFGLWVVHQLCDLVELRSGPGGTTIRMHVRLPGEAGADGPG